MEHPNCPCKPDFPKHLCAPDNIKPTTEDVSVFAHFSSILVFEPTIVGITSKKKFRIQNESAETQMYIVQRDPNTNPIYHAFDFRIPHTSVRSSDYLECTVSYNPRVIHEKNVDYVQIIDSSLRLYKICLQGECIGPKVNASIRTLYFYNSKHGERLSNTFELRNASNVPAIFQFDKNDGSQEMFMLDKNSGVLGPFKHTYIMIQFYTKQTGVFSEHLVCLIMNHPPIMLELVGAHTVNLDFDLAEVELKRFPFPMAEIKGYRGYMFDSIKTTLQKPPFSLSDVYLDFGRVELNSNENNCCTLVTCLTNHGKYMLETVWENDSGNFTITPEDIVIPPGESVLYECQFIPDQPDQLYSKLLKANVYWTNLRKTLKEVAFIEIIDVPLNITLRLLGHSFSASKEWIPLIEIIPNIVILPPCMPMSPSYTTFMLKSSGYLPTAFKFIPPKKTNFVLKPMVGILNEFQIVVAQLEPDLADTKAYVERWGLELNGRTVDSLPVYLKGYSEYAHIAVGVNNVVTFNAVHPGCQDISNVMLKNPSVHFLKYNFVLDEGSPFNIDHPQGQLASNETIILQWFFTGNLKLPEVSVIKCEIQTVQKMKIVTGIPLTTYVTVYTKCIYSELCATPNAHDFGEILWDTRHSTSFHLFNFGESPVHFKLVAKNLEEQVNVVPTRGTVSPREKVRFVIHIHGTQSGREEITLMYKMRLNTVSDVVINDEHGYDIFSVRFNCIYGTLQIEDLPANNFGFLFSKITLWEMFKIDEINKLLREIQHDETKTIKISVPDYEMGDADFFATFLFRNNTIFSTEINLTRQKLCDCKLVTLAKGLSLREKQYDCIHRDMLKLSLPDNVVESKRTKTLRMEVKYLEHGLTQMLYTISFSNNRKLNLYVNINVLPEIVTIASKYAYDFEFHLKSVFIGERQPPAQVFPLYNNSAFMIHYHLDTTPLSKLNFEYDFEILKCLNPEGAVLPFTSKNILFNFTPIENRNYKVSIPLKMGETDLQLRIIGEGVLTYDSHIAEMAGTMPCSSKGLYMQNLIELSTDHLLIEPFPVWSTIEKMIFIRNQSPDRIIGYSWQMCSIEGTVKAEFVHHKGVLQPRESHALIIHINSFDQPCRLRLEMICKLLDHTQHILHTESIVAYNRKQEQLAGQFTITEQGTFYPKNDVVILPKAEQFFMTLAVSLCITSIPDMDLCIDTETQLQQSPQYSLRVHMADIFKKYFELLIPKQTKLHLPALQQIDKTGDQKNPQTQKKCCIINLSKGSVKAFKTVVECLIGDTIFGNVFWKIVDIANSYPQPYYLQFKMDEVKQTTLVRKTTKLEKKGEQYLEKRMELVEDFLNQPQAPFLAMVFKELIVEGIHNVFRLGPQIKNRKKIQHIYYSAKSKFTCPVCKCNY